MRSARTPSPRSARSRHRAGCTPRASLRRRDESATLRDGEDLPAEPRNALDQLALPVLTRLGLGASYRHILTVPGRKTGRLYSTPVDIIELDDQRWLVAGYGPTNWVRNVRAAGEVTLSRARQSDRFRSKKPTVRPSRCFVST